MICSLVNRLAFMSIPQPVMDSIILEELAGLRSMKRPGPQARSGVVDDRTMKQRWRFHCACLNSRALAPKGIPKRIQTLDFIRYWGVGAGFGEGAKTK
jgi:hypothetical protein